jgi:phenylpyruvate tautomerase PptA (4-oxalocrotonate tautomerase family)
MPQIRVSCPKGSLNPKQKAELAKRMVYALIRQEIDPVTEIGIAATGCFYNEIDVANCFNGGVPLTDHPERLFWTVECLVAESYFSQPRRDALQKEIAAAFVDVLGDDGTIMQREDIKISPSYLMRLHVVIVNIPDGSWGAGGRTIQTEEISKLIGATQGPERLKEALDIGNKLKARRIA